MPGLETMGKIKQIYSKVEIIVYLPRSHLKLLFNTFLLRLRIARGDT